MAWSIRSKLICFAVTAICGCGEKKQQCRLISKGSALITVDGRDWAFPGEICNLIGKAIAESSEGTRVDLFGMGADQWRSPHQCTCE